MAAAHVQNTAAANSNTATTNVTVSFTNLPSVGNTLVMGIRRGSGATTSSITDTVNTWTLDKAQANSGASTGSIWRCQVTNAYSGGASVVVNTGTSSVYQIQIEEWSGFLQPVTVDGTDSKGTASSVTSLSTTVGLTTTQTADIVIGIATPGTNQTTAANFTPPASFTVLPEVVSMWNLQMGYWLPGTTLSSHTFTWGWSVSANGTIIFVAYEAVTNSPPNTPTLSSPTSGGTVTTTTPALQFSTTDPDSDAVSYNLQLDTSSSFNSGGIGTISRVATQDCSALNTNGIATATWPATPTQGDLLICIYGNGLGETTLSSSGWTLATTVTTGASNQETIAILYKVAGASESSTIVTFNGAGSGDQYIACYEYTGFNGIPTLDKTATNGTGTSSPFSTGTTATTTQANELLIGGVYSEGTVISFGSWSNSFNNRQSVSSVGNSSLFTADRIVSSTGAYSTALTFTGTTSYIGGAIATFYDGGGPLINALSASGGHDATAFTDVTHGGDTDPFPSGDTIQFTVPGGEALTNSTTYYWRVRAKDPSGTNTYSSYSSTSNFIVNTSSSSSKGSLMMMGVGT